MSTCAMRATALAACLLGSVTAIPHVPSQPADVQEPASSCASLVDQRRWPEVEPSEHTHSNTHNIEHRPHSPAAEQQCFPNPVAESSSWMDQDGAPRFSMRMKIPHWCVELSPPRKPPSPHIALIQVIARKPPAPSVQARISQSPHHCWPGSPIGRSR